MKKLLLILIALPMIGFGQTWENTYGGASNEECYDGEQTTDGGYIITGRVSSSPHILLSKIDAYGDSLWSKFFGWQGTGQIDDEHGYSVRQTNDGGFILVGYSKVVQQAQSFKWIYLVKTDGNGDSLWTKYYPSISAFSANTVQQTNDGGYMICGKTNYIGNGNNRDVFILKTDGNGTQQWYQTYGGADYEQPWAPQQTTDGG